MGPAIATVLLFSLRGPGHRIDASSKTLSKDIEIKAHGKRPRSRGRKQTPWYQAITVKKTISIIQDKDKNEHGIVNILNEM